jgi:hypothetical protein
MRDRLARTSPNGAALRAGSPSVVSAIVGRVTGATSAGRDASPRRNRAVRVSPRGENSRGLRGQSSVRGRRPGVVHRISPRSDWSFSLKNRNARPSLLLALCGFKIRPSGRECIPADRGCEPLHSAPLNWFAWQVAQQLRPRGSSSAGRANLTLSGRKVLTYRCVPSLIFSALPHPLSSSSNRFPHDSPDLRSSTWASREDWLLPSSRSARFAVPLRSQISPRPLRPHPRLRRPHPQQRLRPPRPPIALLRPRPRPRHRERALRRPPVTRG